ncbi:hypothetical protein GJ744_004916 [Endocarpon pusillum]|uniref:Uncharacterized protein n=1 Tax=Endocarpon pusillum TaxID=364733 RepID=A0A8H7AQI6_9EURO|nr:hypothetical protein GJ744_004916 [Endocarpon pusillum]
MPAEKSSSLDNRRALRESRLRPWLSSIDSSKVATRLQELRNRRQASEDATRARSQAPSRMAPEKASPSQVRSQAKPTVAPDKASISQARPQVSRVQEALKRIQARRDAQQARPQASIKAAPVVASRFRPVGESRTMEILAKKERAHAPLQEAKDDIFASRLRGPQAVAKAHQSESKLVVPEVLPNESARPPSSASSTLPSGGQSCSNTQRGAGAANSSARLVSRSNRPSTIVTDSSLPSGVYEKVTREGSHGPAYTLNKVSWKFRNGWENVFSP